VRIIARLACIFYWLFLTVLLLVPNPATLVGLKTVPLFPWGKFGIHLSFFTVLGLLVNAARWPKGPWWPLVALLMVYGIATEFLQIVVPQRSARVMDGFEDVLGITIGVGIYWIILLMMQPMHAAATNSEVSAE
jgi:hypothetical protein